MRYSPEVHSGLRLINKTLSRFRKKSATRMIYTVKSKGEYIKSSTITAAKIDAAVQIYLTASKAIYKYEYKCIAKSEATSSRFLYKLWFKKQLPAEFIIKTREALIETYLAEYKSKYFYSPKMTL
jgi:hypothetical protein